jgi:hypothetical protein
MAEINRDWLASEHHRLHHVERWPDSPRKQAVLGAIQSTLSSLLRHPATEPGIFNCFICQSKNAKLVVLDASASSHEPRLFLTDVAEWQRTG